MKILFMMPDWAETSQFWLQRMITLLQADIELIASRNADEKWNGKIDCFRLLKNNAKKKTFKHRATKVYYSVYAKGKNKRALRREIEKRNIDAILIHFAGFAMKTKPAWSGFEARVFVHIHGYDIAFDGRSAKGHHQPLHDDAYIDQFKKLIDDVEFISNSRYSSSLLSSIGVPEEKIHLKYFGVEKQNTAILHEARNKRNGAVRLLYVGRLIDWKGPDQVLLCFEELRARGLNATLTIAGSGELASTCQKIIDQSRYKADIRLLGALNYGRVKELYESSDIFVNFHHKGQYTNREEAFGVTLIEAMSFGLPVLTGASGGPAESVIDGVTGYLVTPGNHDAYLDRLLELCSDKAKRLQMGIDAAAHVEKNFSLEQEAARMKDIMGLDNT